ncbi:pimeloyl-ACP methyl ester carboxylesterase [Nocardia transvalensis]|uniref:Pimeloyl-ACP methyl ester carboxylesterase n=1 Tax=Nocardia transvalensis TaxID=37333 RepID=A0A7W9PFL4_9NOCA|nr:alpha/beta hydrolase [Nocardia transvalensis]MBB5914699.1 pimeloyl-ACP methyl ester carboxylesterase [Nocardia transvalensis]
MKPERPHGFRATAWRGGIATAGALGALAGVHALRRVGASVSWPAHRDDLRDEDFGLLGRDRADTVVAEDGVELAVRHCGPEDAPVTAVFVHGFCNSMESFHFQRRDLEKQWGPRVRMVFFDLRGHGGSGVPSTESCTVPQLGRDLAAVIERCAPDGPLLLTGHSMGGMAILAAAAQFPRLFAERVRAVALLSTAAAEVTATGVAQLLRNPAIDGFRMAALAAPALVQAGRVTARHVIAPILYASSFHGEVSPTLSRFTTSMIDRTPVETIVKFLRALELHDESAALPTLAPLPALVLGGTHDQVIPFRNSRALARELPDADLVRVTDAAHMVHLQYPDLVDAALDRLLLRSGVLGAGERSGVPGAGRGDGEGVVGG